MKSQLIALAAAALLVAAGVSQAQDANPSSTPAASGGGGASGVREACAADFAKVCPNITDRPALRQCVTDHFADLSDGCKAAISAMRSQMQQSGGGSH